VRRIARRFLALDGSTQRLVLRALGTVIVVRAGLSLLPYRVMHRVTASRAVRANALNRHSAARIAWAVEAVSRAVPRASCLTQALAATVLLASNGHASTLRVGVAKDPDGSLRAHAWIEYDGRAILGDPRADAFVPLPPLAARS
jgi:hypothetical protein